MRRPPRRKVILHDGWDVATGEIKLRSYGNGNIAGRAWALTALGGIGTTTRGSLASTLQGDGRVINTLPSIQDTTANALKSARKVAGGTSRPCGGGES